MCAKVSIIIPVYKAELYLDRCIKSIIAQSYTDWELILIDDGSPDRSGKICDAYAERDSRIIAIHKENGGVSSARNEGLNVACSEWICFVDADDYIATNYLEVLNYVKSDLIVLSAQHIAVNGNLKNQFEILDEVRSTDKILTRKIIESNIDATLFKTPWAKIFKRSYIQDLKFDTNVWIGEDTLFLYNYLKNINSIEICQGYLYFWQNTDESAKLKYLLTPKQSVIIVEKIYNAYKQLNIYSPKGELSIILFFFRITNKSVGYSQMKVWYNSKTVQSLESLMKKNLSKLDYFKYKLWKFPVLEKIFVKCLKILCKTKNIFKPNY